MRLVLGGTFDPIHNGHVHAALAVSELFENQPVGMILAPAAQRRTPPIATVRQRWEMLLRACRSDDRLCPMDLEMQRSGHTLTADTTVQLGGTTTSPIVWIVGSDLLQTMSHWQKLDLLAHTASLCVLRRPGVGLSARVVGFSEVTDKNKLMQASARMFVVSSEMRALSATDVRAKIALGKPIDRLVSASVREYIISNNLYRD